MSEYFVTKVFPAPSKGVSCAFRQWRAKSHCRFIHGYDLVFALTFACEPEHLTKEGWVIDFGDLDYIKSMIDSHFDHKLIVAEDDPCLDIMRELANADMAELTVLPNVGCEAFAAWLARTGADYLHLNNRLGPVRVMDARVYEHGANVSGFKP